MAVAVLQASQSALLVVQAVRVMQVLLAEENRAAGEGVPVPVLPCGEGQD